MNSACFVVSPGLQFFEITGYSANFYSTPVSTLLNKYSSDAVFEQTIFKEQQQGRNIVAVIEERFVISKRHLQLVFISIRPLASFVKITPRKFCTRNFD